MTQKIQSVLIARSVHRHLKHALPEEVIPAVGEKGGVISSQIHQDLGRSLEVNRHKVDMKGSLHLGPAKYGKVSLAMPGQRRRRGRVRRPSEEHHDVDVFRLLAFLDKASIDPLKSVIEANRSQRLSMQQPPSKDRFPSFAEGERVNDLQD